MAKRPAYSKLCKAIEEGHFVFTGELEPKKILDLSEIFHSAEEMKKTATAAKHFGVDVVNGFTGSSVWAKLYFFPPTTQDDVNAGYQDFADRWLPIMDVFKKEGVI